MWQPALKRGRGLEAQGYVVRVWDAGVYLLYSQVTPNVESHMGAWKPIFPEPYAPILRILNLLFIPNLEDPSLFLGRALRPLRTEPYHPVFNISSLPCQVLFHDVTFTMGQVVSREGQGKQETLFRCIRSMPSNPDWAYNSCYSAGNSSVGSGEMDMRRAGHI